MWEELYALCRIYYMKLFSNKYSWLFSSLKLTAWRFLVQLFPILEIYISVGLLHALLFFHILYSFTLEITSVFDPAVMSICKLLCRCIYNSSNFERDCILHCPLLFNETSSSVSSTLAMTLAPGSLLCSAFSEQIAQTKCLDRFKNLLSYQKYFSEKQRKKKQVESSPTCMETERWQVFLIHVDCWK